MSGWASSFKWQQNRFSVLLSLLRSRLPLGEYRRLLRMHELSYRLFRTLDSAGDLEWLWIRELKNELDNVFAGLEMGEPADSQLQRLVHLYRDFFLIGEIRRRKGGPE